MKALLAVVVRRALYGLRVLYFDAIVIAIVIEIISRIAYQ